jgi:16S rRNA (adenine1518-N6/adenine1519-N6)-dimethyltransferase
LSTLDLCREETARAIARRFQVSPQRGLGQNFLVDSEVRDSIVAALPSDPGRVVEIGCGLGALTQGLLRTGHLVTGIEIDPGCVAALGLLRADYPQFEVVPADALRVGPTDLGLTGHFTVVGNLPYQITGAILPRLMEWVPRPRSCHFLVQREVARRLAATAGDWSVATLGLRAVADVEVRFDIGPESFWPSPKVHSSLVSISPRQVLDPGLQGQLMALARPMFQQRRKQLHHGLANALGISPPEAASILRSLGIDPQRRPGTLDLSEWWLLLGGLGAGWGEVE